MFPVDLVCPGRSASGRRRLRGNTSPDGRRGAPAGEDAGAGALTEQELAEAEAYEAEWREEDKKKYHEERLP
jgi:hypothetical protein